MKTCPICKARCFDDMEICYGCMHRFSEDAASQMRAEDAVDVKEMPLQPGRIRDAEPAGGHPAQTDDVDVGGGKPLRGMHAADAPGSRRQMARKDPSRVFGAVDNADLEPERTHFGNDIPFAPPDGARMPEAGGDNPLALAVGPLVSVALGNGYRLVVSVEAQ